MQQHYSPCGASSIKDIFSPMRVHRELFPLVGSSSSAFSFLRVVNRSPMELSRYRCIPHTTIPLLRGGSDPLLIFRASSIGIFEQWTTMDITRRSEHDSFRPTGFLLRPIATRILHPLQSLPLLCPSARDLYRSLRHLVQTVRCFVPLVGCLLVVDLMAKVTFFCRSLPPQKRCTCRAAGEQRGCSRM